MQWKVAALVLVTFPLAVWASFNFNGRARQIVLFLGVLPLFLGVTIELIGTWRRALRDPNFRYEGSPTGNKIAVALGVMLLALFTILVIYRVVHGA